MNKKITILDGGLGRELQRIGAPFSQPLWSAQALMESPQHVRQAHQNFVNAGAEIITVNSYACVPFHLGDGLYQTDGAKLARQAAEIAYKQVQASSVLVAGSIPPAFGSYRPDLFKPIVAKSIFTTLRDAQDDYVDLWIAETIASLAELEVIYSVLSESQKKTYYAFSLDDDSIDIAKLRSGERVKQAVEYVCTHGGEGIFFNCSIPEVMEQAIIDTQTIIHHHNLQIEIGVYANNFTPIRAEHNANDVIQELREFSPEVYLQFAKRWYQLGATVIGGCCGIRPDHIQALSEWKKSQDVSI